MQVILTDFNNPIRCKKFDGTIELHEFKVWPAWTVPKFTNLFFFNRDGKSYNAPVAMGKTYTFKDLELAVNEYLNVDEQVASLYYNNGRVTWRVYPNTKTTNVTLNLTLVDMLNLATAKVDKDGIQTGQPIDKSSITFTFSDARVLFLTCDQIDDTVGNDNRVAKNITAIPLIDGSFTTTLNHPTVSTFHNNYSRELTFHTQDLNGNDLPMQNLLARLTINE